ncbi:hypothetical protein AB0M36_27830 [Actinoplanes sp. NPDC051346]|uniref:hypothetical protein n=1 Tax=Actinoplanes sp. NPDC051346 TaxID=3155048 RepID=UPI003432AA03
MTQTGHPEVVPSPAPRRRAPRWWLIAIVAVWALVLAGAAVWSVRNDPPTVVEQRDIAAALPVLHRAAGAVVTAADAPDRTIEIGPLRFDTRCGLTSVRAGVEASQEITVRVRADQAPGALESIARALPRSYKPAIRHLDNDTRHVLRADAGEFIEVEATAENDGMIIAVRILTGCRPPNAGVDLAAAPRPAATTPDALSAAMTAVKAAGPATSVEVACPNGKTAATVTVGGPTMSGDLGRALRDAVGDGLVVRAEPRAWAYRVGEVSVLVTGDEGDARVSATTSCR